jgi:hypothetical protein
MGHRAGRQGWHQDDDRRHEDDDSVAPDSFNASPIGDGYEVQVNEFDFRDDNGICYNKILSSSATGADRTPRTAPRPTGSTGMGCRLDRRRRPDELANWRRGGRVRDQCNGHCQPQAMKFGMPPIILNTTIDQAHSPITRSATCSTDQPRLAMVTPELRRGIIPEIVADCVHSADCSSLARRHRGRQRHQDAIWTRKAASRPATWLPRPRDAIGLF